MATLKRRITVTEEFIESPELAGVDDLGDAENENVEVEVDDQTEGAEPKAEAASDDGDDSDDEKDLDRKCAARATKKRGGVW